MDKEDFIKLIDFIDNTILSEIHIEKDGKILLFIPYTDMKNFADIFGYEYFCDGGVDCTLVYENIIVDLQDFLEDEDLNIIRKRYKGVNYEF